MCNRRMCSICMLAALLAANSGAVAQTPRYMSPAGSPIPNALNYFRFDGLTPLLDSYRGVVVPQQNLSYQLQSMTAREQTDFRTTQRSLQDIRESEAGPTGVGATFMNYSHYYRGGGGSGGRGRTSAKAGRR